MSSAPPPPPPSDHDRGSTSEPAPMFAPHGPEHVQVWTIGTSPGADRRRRRRVAWVIAAAVAFVAALLIVGVLLIRGDQPTRIPSSSATPIDPLPTATDLGDAPDDTSDNLTDVLRLQTGDCLPTTLSSGSVKRVTTVACTEPHLYEVYASFQLDRQSYPGDDAVAGQAKEGCAARLDQTIDTGRLQAASATITVLFPERDEWAVARTVSCLIEFSIPVSTPFRDYEPPPSPPV